MVDEISPAELKERLDRGEDIQVIDIRQEDSFEEGHIPGATNIPFQRFAREIDEHEWGGEIVVVEAYVYNTGRTSLDVKVDVHAENARTAEERETTTSFFTFVALDDEGVPTPVPDVSCPTDEERALRDDAVAERVKRIERLVERFGV